MELSTLCPQVVDLAREVGVFIRQEADVFDRSVTEYKGSPNNLVSYVDKTAEERLVAGLGQLLPEAGFITEEGTTEQATGQEYVWVIDPPPFDEKLTAGMRPVWRGPGSVLYQVKP